MRRILLILCWWVCAAASVLWAQVQYTHPLVTDLATLQVIADGDFRKLPVIDNSPNSSVEISFDILSDEEEFLQYRVIHCDAQWMPDDLSELDYIDGFQPTRISRVAPSFNTFVNYWHYSLSFPNADVRLLLSGNYAVIIHPEDDPDSPLAVACFSVSEQRAFVNGEVSGNTDIDFRQEHQQLTLQCSWSQQQLPYLSPTSDLRLVVTQNRRPDTRRVIFNPSRVEGGKAYYEHLRPLIFDAGNTFRRFEFINRHYATLGIERLRYHAPYYHTELITQRARSGGHFVYDQDQHGRYLVHALGVDDKWVESEYFVAEFRLDGAMPSHGNDAIYLTGDFTYGELTPTYRMEYDPDEQCYRADVLLKQGHYNYQFVTGPEWTPLDGLDSPEAPASRISLAACEGNYYETPNQYDVYVYYRGPSDRYDRLLGVATVTQ